MRGLAYVHQLAIIIEMAVTPPSLAHFSVYFLLFQPPVVICFSYHNVTVTMPHFKDVHVDHIIMPVTVVPAMTV